LNSEACGLLGLRMFLLGAGVGVVLTYLPYSFQVAELRRKLEKASTVGNSKTDEAGEMKHAEKTHSPSHGIVRPTTIIEAPRLGKHLGVNLILASETFSIPAASSFALLTASHRASRKKCLSPLPPEISASSRLCLLTPREVLHRCNANKFGEGQN